MATNATPQPTAADANSLTPEQIAEQLANQAAPQTTGIVAPPQTPDGLERDFSVVLETGQTYKAKTKDELIQQLVKAQEHSSKRIKELASSPPNALPQQPVPTGPQYSKDQYWQTAAEDPVQAFDYVLQFSPQAKKLQETVARLEAMERDVSNQREVNTFQNIANDFDSEDPQVVNKFEEEWNKLNLPITAQNMLMAHSLFLRTGVYQPKVAQVQPVASGIQPLPTLGNNPASGQPAQQVDPNTMSTTDLAALIKSLNGQ